MVDAGSRVQAVVLGCLVVGSVLLSGCIGSQTTQHFQKSVPAVAGTLVTVKNMNGRVVITGWNQSIVNVSAEKVSFGGQSELDKAVITVSEGSNTVAIETKYTGSSLNPPSVSYVIQVPVNAVVGSVESTNGQVQVHDVSGNVSISTTNGEVIVENVSGYVSVGTSNGHVSVLGTMGIRDLGTSNGAVEAEVRDFPGNTSITSSNGRVMLLINTGLNATFEFTTSNANIQTNDLPLSLIASGSTHLVGTLGGGGKRLTVTTSNGAILLYKLSIT